MEPVAIPHRYDCHTVMESAEIAGVLPRAAMGAIRRALEVAPVVVVLGARQTGKSTLVR
jgi:predicted AAA+ superfamily ATPase